MGKSKIEWIQVTPDMRNPALSELTAGMTVYVALPEDPVRVREEILRGPLNVKMPTRFKDVNNNWTDRVIETREEYDEGYGGWIKFLVKNKLLFVK